MFILLNIVFKDENKDEKTILNSKINLTIVQKYQRYDIHIISKIYNKM